MGIRGKAKAKENKERVRAIKAKGRGIQVPDHPGVDVSCATDRIGCPSALVIH